MRLICGVHVVWCYLVLEPSTTFSQVLWSMLWPHHQMWLMWLIISNPNPRVQKIKNKLKHKIKKKKKIKKTKSTFCYLNTLHFHCLSLFLLLFLFLCFLFLFLSYFFSCFFFFLFLPPWFSLRWPSLLFILLWTSRHFYLFYLPVYLWIVPSQLWYS